MPLVHNRERKLETSSKLSLGKTGLGAGAKPEAGKAAADAHKDVSEFNFETALELLEHCRSNLPQ